MKIKQEIISKNKYTEPILRSQVDGYFTFTAKKDDSNKKAYIVSRRVSKRIADQIKKMNKNEAFFIFKHKYIQKYVERPFLQSINEQYTTEVYYLIPLQLARNTIKNTLSVYNSQERTEIAYKVAKVVDILHNKENRFHGNLELSTVCIKEKQDQDGIQVRIIPPFPEIVSRDAFCERSRSFYRAPQTSKGPFGNKIDIWSLGIILYQLFIGRQVSQTIVQVTQQVLASFQHNLDFHLIKSIPIRNLIKKMLDRNPETRLQIQQVLNILKRQASKQIYGCEYRIPLINEQKYVQKQRPERKIKGDELTKEHRILLKDFLLVIKYIKLNQNEQVLKFELHFKINFLLFLHVEYYYQQLPPEIRNMFTNLQELYLELQKKEKPSIKFETDGFLVINYQAEV